jgi:hypothetical protein
VIHEVEYRDKVSILDTLQVQQRVLVLITPQDSTEEGRTSRQDHFVCLQLVILTSKSNIKEIFVFS